MYLTQISWKSASMALRGQIQILHTNWLWIRFNWFHFFWFMVMKLMALKNFFLLKDIFLQLSKYMRLFESNLWDSYNAFSCYCLSWEQSNDSVWILLILNLTSEYLGGCGWGHDCLIPKKFSGYLVEIQVNLVFSQLYTQMSHLSTKGMSKMYENLWLTLYLTLSRGFVSKLFVFLLFLKLFLAKIFAMTS